MTDIQSALKEYSAWFNSKLEDFFPFPDGQEKRVVEAMRYSVMNGGKRLRPFLVYSCASLFSISREQSLNTAAALEMLHSYSLIHDDLPAMDNDTLRRGLPTCHCQFDEATAILAGDGLLTYAFEILSRPQTADEKSRLELIALLSRDAGAFCGMVAGQMLDLYAENTQEPDKNLLIQRIENMKTGCLIRFACEAGAILGHADNSSRQALVSYARAIGQTFQISDDILDVEGSRELMGKTLQKDQGQGKVTFVSLYGLDKAKAIAQELTDQAKEALSGFGPNVENLRNLADFIISRNH